MIHEIKKHSLYAFYDLSVAPLTFDFLQFLVLADIERSKKKLSDLTVVIIPATEETRDPGLKDRFSRSDRNWRLSQILAPACALLPSCSGKVMICGSREDGANVVEFAGNNIFPLHYTIESPVACFQLAEVVAAYACGESIPSLKATSQATEIIQQWIQARASKKNVISITLREAPYGEEKNSNIAAWGQFARNLIERDYFPVIIRDTYKALGSTPEALTGIQTFGEASINIDLRMAFYQASYLNLFTNGGPQVLCHLNQDTRCLVFKPLVKNWHDSTKFGLTRGAGVQIGEQINFLPPNQLWIWQDDDYANIHHYFEKMASVLELEARLGSSSKIVSKNVGEREPIEKLLTRLESNNSWAAAAKILKYLLDENPNEFNVLYRLGVCEVWTNQLVLAAKHFELASEIDGSNNDLLIAMGDLAVKRGDTHDAIIQYRRVLNLNPENARAYIRLGMLLDTIGELDSAATMFENALRYCPYDQKIMRLYARFLEKIGNSEKAEKLLAEAEKIEPQTREISL